MTDSSVTKVQDFRNRLFRLFRFRADATMDFIDALASFARESVVKISLSDLFRRTYCSITDVIDNMFRRKTEQNPTEQELREDQLKITELLSEQCEISGNRGFVLLATDCTAKPRIYAKTVTDRSIVHAPNHVPGQKPITVGHEYSLVVFLPEDECDRRAHWTFPLSIKRVHSHEKGPQVAFEQIKAIVSQPVFKDQLCVDVSDAAYSNNFWISKSPFVPNLVHISRLRNNRILFLQPDSITGKKTRGRPKKYGTPFRLNDPPQPDQEENIHRISSSGKPWIVRICRWNNLLTKGDEEHHTEKYPFDAVRVQVFGSDGKMVFKKSLWLGVVGTRRSEVTQEQTYDSYAQRYDIEHWFRFEKQNLALSKTQTPDTRHEENLTWLSMLSFAMLYQVRHFASEERLPWERRRVRILPRTISPSQVQRDYNRIIRRIGTPASLSKPRGKSAGRPLGTIVPHRMMCPIVKKTRSMAVRC